MELLTLLGSELHTKENIEHFYRNYLKIILFWGVDGLLQLILRASDSSNS